MNIKMKEIVVMAHEQALVLLQARYLQFIWMRSHPKDFL